MSIEVTYTEQQADGIIRVFEGTDSENLDPFQGVISVKFYTDTAYLFGVHGDLSKKSILKIVEVLKLKGVKTALIERTQNHTVPLAKPVAEEGKTTLWLVDLNGPKLSKLLQRICNG